MPGVASREAHEGEEAMSDKVRLKSAYQGETCDWCGKAHAEDEPLYGNRRVSYCIYHWRRILNNAFDSIMSPRWRKFFPPDPVKP